MADKAEVKAESKIEYDAQGLPVYVNADRTIRTGIKREAFFVKVEKGNQVQKDKALKAFYDYMHNCKQLTKHNLKLKLESIEEEIVSYVKLRDGVGKTLSPAEVLEAKKVKLAKMQAKLEAEIAALG